MDKPAEETAAASPAAEKTEEAPAAATVAATTEEPAKAEEPVAAAAPVAAEEPAKPAEEPVAVPAPAVEETPSVAETTPAEPAAVQLENGHAEKNGVATPEEEPATEVVPSEPEVKIQEVEDKMETVEEAKEEATQEVEKSEATQQQEEVKEVSAPAVPQEPVLEEKEQVVEEEVTASQVVEEEKEEMEVKAADPVVEAPPPLPEIPPPSKMIQFAERTLSGEETPQITIAAPAEDVRETVAELVAAVEEEKLEEAPVIVPSDADLPPPPPSPPIAEMEELKEVEEEEQKEALPSAVVAAEGAEQTDANIAEPIPALSAVPDVELELVTEQISDLALATEQQQQHTPEVTLVGDEAEVPLPPPPPPAEEEEEVPKQEEQIAETIALIDQVNEAALTSSTESAPAVEQAKVEENGQEQVAEHVNGSVVVEEVVEAEGVEKKESVVLVAESNGDGGDEVKESDKEAVPVPKEDDPMREVAVVVTEQAILAAVGGDEEVSKKPVIDIEQIKKEAAKTTEEIISKIQNGHSEETNGKVDIAAEIAEMKITDATTMSNELVKPAEVTADIAAKNQNVGARSQQTKNKKKKNRRR